MKRLITAIAFTAITGPALAEFYDGNRLHSACVSNNSVAGAYVTGVADLMQGIDQRQRVCIPTNASVGQITDIVCSDLRAMPEIRHHIASDFVVLSLSAAFPCGL